MIDLTPDKIQTDKLMNLRSKLFRGFADTTRLSILYLLMEGPKSVGEIVRDMDIPQSTVSSQLSCLRECNLIRSEKDGRKRIYRLTTPLISEILCKADELLKTSYNDIYHCVNYGG